MRSLQVVNTSERSWKSNPNRSSYTIL